MQSKSFPMLLRSCCLVLFLVCKSTSHAQRKDSAALSKMSPLQLTEYYTKYGYRTTSGQFIERGTAIRLLRGTANKDRFEMVYCAPSYSALGISTRSRRGISRTPKKFAGSKAYVAEIWAIGTRSQGHRIVAWCGGIRGWCDVWIDIEDALKLGEVEIVEQ